MDSFKRTLHYLLCLSISFSPGVFLQAANADSIDDYMVSFETIDCDGQIGMGLVQITEIYRINPYKCPGGDQMAQLLTKNEGDKGATGIFLIAPEEVKSIQEEVKVWQAAKRQQLLNTERIIID